MLATRHRKLLLELAVRSVRTLEGLHEVGALRNLARDLRVERRKRRVLARQMRLRVGARKRIGIARDLLFERGQARSERLRALLEQGHVAASVFRFVEDRPRTAQVRRSLTQPAALEKRANLPRERLLLGKA